MTPKVEVRPAPEPDPEPEPIAMLDNEPLAEAPNPFADSVPFPESDVPVEADYDRAEEVSLDQLLAEGRSRPSTFAGNVPVPVAEEHVDDADEVEELGAEHLVEETPVAVEVLPEAVEVLAEAVEVLEEAVEVAEPIEVAEPVVFADSRVTELESQIAALEQKLQVREIALQSILQELDDLRARVSAQLE
jgi:hypothetical protein